MRTPSVALAASLLCGCSSTVLLEPELRVSPYLAIYELRGDTRMQSFDPGPPPQYQENGAQPLRTFGQDRFREDVGVRADLGDGFGGVRADYYRLDMNTSRRGVLEENWGRLPAGEMVAIYASMDELRLGYIEPLLDLATEYRDEELRVRFGLGGVFATRSMRLRGKTDDNTLTQNVDIDGDVVYVAARAQVTWREFALDVDYAIAPDELVLSGDLEDTSQDIEARLSYQLPQRDIRFFVGARYSELNASGDANGFRYETDLIIDGLQLGASVTF